MKARNCLLHDAHAHQDLKMQRLIFVHGFEGYGIFWILAESMRVAKDYSLRVSDLELIAFKSRIELPKLQAIVETCLQVELIREENGTYFAPALSRDMESLTKKQDQWRTKKKRQRTNEGTKEGHEGDTISCPDHVPSGHVEVRTIEDRTKKKEQRRKKTEPKTIDELEDFGKSPHGECGHVWLTAKESEALSAKFGSEFAERCIEKLDAWIEQNPTQNRKINGQNGAATLRSWVIRAVTEEKAKAEKVQGNGPLKPHQVMSTQQRTAMETIKFFEEREKNANK
jgi:hypothetical protein